jgi:hypothetical protein
MLDRTDAFQTPPDERDETEHEACGYDQDEQGRSTSDGTAASAAYIASHAILF